jgi:dTDP-4-amino-4,6-dideoxygalactose transaminase
MVPVNDLKRHIMPLRGELEAATAKVIAGGRFILGQACEGFEAAFARYCGAADCVGVANGTDALELALRALGIGAGARVATVANAGMYSTAAILAVGARPVFIDIDPDTLVLSPAALRAAERFDAVIVTHLYGRMAEMPEILAAVQGAPVIEDCAQAHGAALDGRKAGIWGTLGCFSFYPTKNLGALGDGGAVVTSDAALATRLRRLRQYGWTARYRAELPGGMNSRLDEMQAAMLLVLLPHLDGWNACRRAIAARYRAALGECGLIWTRPAPEGADVAHLCVVRSSARNPLRAALAESGIDSDVHYPILDYRQPAVVAAIGESGPLAESELATASVLTLPCFPEMTDAEIGAVIDAVAACAERFAGASAQSQRCGQKHGQRS